MNNLNEKVAVITGGNSGIGYETAKKLKSEGAQVVIIGRSKEKVKKAANDLEVTGIVADVQNLAALQNAADSVKEKFKQIDILSVNAGVYFGAPIGETPEAIFDQQLNINFKGAVYTIEKFLPLINDGGNIIGLSTTLTSTGIAGASIYSASKAALDTYLKTAVTELAPRKIRVNNIKPGPITTPIYGKTGIPEDQLNSFAEQLQKRVPLKTFGNPEDVAHAVAFIASDDAKFINGAEITVDGGLNVNPVIG